MTATKTVTVSILDKEYQIACPPDEVAGLRRSAAFIDGKMREIREQSNIFGLDRIAVMTALNIAHDLMQHRDDASDTTDAVTNMSAKLDSAILRLRGEG